MENTGVRVETAQGRRILKETGALVDDAGNIVRFPQRLIEEALKSVSRDFILGARRPGADLKMNGGDCTLCLDGCGYHKNDNDNPMGVDRSRTTS